MLGGTRAPEQQQDVDDPVMVRRHLGLGSGWPGWHRTSDFVVNSDGFYHLNYRPKDGAIGTDSNLRPERYERPELPLHAYCPCRAFEASKYAAAANSGVSK